MRLYPDTKIYIVCPANYRSGGPESLHQLCSKLIEFGIDAKIIYSFGANKMNTADPVDETYKKYHVSWCLPQDLPKIDLAKNILIINEGAASSPYVVKKMRLIFWWLSVDTYFRNIIDLVGEHLLNPLGAPVPKFFYFNKTEENIEHWGQSEYVRQFLRLNGIKKVRAIETPMRQNFLIRAAQVDLLSKKNIVVYNPKKGFEVAKQIMDAAPDITWRPIENMTPAQVQNLLLQAKVYIDFGNFPGRERLPREAALSGCVVITGKRGAAANDVDINIPAEFKFDERISTADDIIKKIREVFFNFEAAYAKQKAFRDKELNVKRNFALEVAEAFGIAKFPAPTVALTQGVGEESFQLAAELFKSADFVPNFIIDDVLALTKISDKLILREQNRNYLRVGKNFIEIITRDDAKFLYLEGRIKKFALLEPTDNELAEVQNFYAPAANDLLIFTR